MELSIIIPMYNAEKYIRECLDSIICFQSNEVECIIVNDGSQDSSPMICKEFVEKDSRFKLVNGENAGVSAARNKGIEVATGKYIFFLDADDYMDSAAWKQIELFTREQKYDFIGFSYYTLYNNGHVKEQAFSFAEKACDDINELRRQMFASSSLNTCWGKLYLRDTINQHHIKFRTDLKIGEDFIFAADYFQVCQTAILYNIPVLYYRQHSASAMRSVDLNKRLDYTDILFTYNKKAVKTYQDKDLEMAMYNYYLRVLTNLFLEFAKGQTIRKLSEDYKEALQRRVIKEIVDNLELSKFSLYKRVEGRLIRNKKYVRLALYFKLKACFVYRG
jgi:glycosyltransferase involved in cell wall biosynthesis